MADTSTPYRRAGGGDEKAAPVSLFVFCNWIVFAVWRSRTPE